MSQARSEPIYDVVMARGLKVTARDGVKLNVDIYRPARNGEPLPGPFPCIVTRSPYDTRSGKGPSSQQRNGEFFAKHGFLYAVQDARGRFESEGEFVLLNTDGEDGYDVIEWLAALPYCDGNVGTQGTSLRAWNQNAAALENPPHLRCMWVNQGGSNGNKTALRHNGALELRWLSWAVTYAPLAHEAQRDPKVMRSVLKGGEDLYDWFKKLPWTPGNSPLSAMPNWEKWAIDLYTHGDMSDFWLNPSRNFEPYIDKSANVPTMYAGAWYDSYSLATIDKFDWFKNTKQHQYLLMGAGIHGGPNFDNPIAGEVDMGPRAKLAGVFAKTRLHMMLDWFDCWLKGVKNGVDQAPKVRYFVMGGDGSKNASGQLLHGGDWREAADWPPPQSKPTDFFLHPDGGLSTTPHTSSESYTSYRFDPADPLPSIAGNVSSLTENLKLPARVKMPDPNTFRRLMFIQGAADQVGRDDVHGGWPKGKPLADRSDVIVFETEPLEKAVEVIGNVSVDLWLSTSAPDTDLFCMLLDIYPESPTWPEGYRMNITDGLMRVRYRDAMDKPTMMKPGVPARVRFDLYPTSNRFEAGHRIQLLISSSSFPRFDVNPNTGEAIGRHTHMIAADNTIHHDASRPSKIVLPLFGG
jgi:putative CocE/NonD family hydrolase